MGIEWLHDQVHLATFEPKKHLGTHLDKKQVEQIMRRYRMRIRSAQRFAIDDDFMRVALKASREISRVKHWLNLARLPFPVTWIEWNCHAKIAASRADGALVDMADRSLDRVPPREGLLLEEIDQESGAWMGTTFSTLDGHTSPLSHVWLVAPEGPSHHAIRPPRDLRSLADEFGLPEQIGMTGIGMVATEGDRVAVAAPPWAENRIGLALEPIWAQGNRTIDRRWVAEHVLNNLMEESGVIRFLIAVLGMLNAAPNLRSPVAPHPGHRFAGMRRVRYLDTHVVSIALPKTKPVTRLIGMLNKAARDRRRNRAHMVRGHFRQVERGRHMPVPCQHAPTMVENGVGICLRCERLIKWIEPHARGDATIGWVSHDYALTKGKG